MKLGHATGIAGTYTDILLSNKYSNIHFFFKYKYNTSIKLYILF